MSNALTYLVKARPEAMGAYFKFLKGAGTHLDPKTRNLISVITKVHAQTENGLRQYLTRALREGATADEILDALLMAFPALGLAKIVWAIDVILGMDLPEFRLDRSERVPAWHDAAPMTAVTSSSTTSASIAPFGDDTAPIGSIDPCNAAAASVVGLPAAS